MLSKLGHWCKKPIQLCPSWQGQQTCVGFMVTVWLQSCNQPHLSAVSVLRFFHAASQQCSCPPVVLVGAELLSTQHSPRREDQRQLQTVARAGTGNPPVPPRPATRPLLSLPSWDVIERFAMSGVLVVSVLRRQ